MGLSKEAVHHKQGGTFIPPNEGTLSLEAASHFDNSGETLILENECGLCKLFTGGIRTKLWYKCKDFIIVNCDNCEVPMVVLEKHITNYLKHISMEVIECIKRKLKEIGTTFFNGNDFYIDKHMNLIKNHTHWHIRKKNKNLDWRTQLYLVPNNKEFDIEKVHLQERRIINRKDLNKPFGAFFTSSLMKDIKKGLTSDYIEWREYPCVKNEFGERGNVIVKFEVVGEPKIFYVSDKLQFEELFKNYPKKRPRLNMEESVEWLNWEQIATHYDGVCVDWGIAEDGPFDKWDTEQTAWFHTECLNIIEIKEIGKDGKITTYNKDEIINHKRKIPSALEDQPRSRNHVEYNEMDSRNKEDGEK